jgi:hypothetical protein
LIETHEHAGDFKKVSFSVLSHVVFDIALSCRLLLSNAKKTNIVMPTDDDTEQQFDENPAESDQLSEQSDEQPAETSDQSAEQTDEQAIKESDQPAEQEEQAIKESDQLAEQEEQADDDCSGWEQDPVSFSTYVAKYVAKMQILPNVDVLAKSVACKDERHCDVTLSNGVVMRVAWEPSTRITLGRWDSNGVVLRSIYKYSCRGGQLILTFKDFRRGPA